MHIEVEIADSLSWQGPAEPLAQLSQMWVPGATSFRHVHKLQREEVVWVLLLVSLADNPRETALCSIISSLSPTPSPAAHHWGGESQRRGGDGPALGEDVFLTCRNRAHLFCIPCAKDLRESPWFWGRSQFQRRAILARVADTQ